MGRRKSSADIIADILRERSMKVEAHVRKATTEPAVLCGDDLTSETRDPEHVKPLATFPRPAAAVESDRRAGIKLLVRRLLLGVVREHPGAQLEEVLSAVREAWPARSGPTPAKDVKDDHEQIRAAYEALRREGHHRKATLLTLSEKLARSVSSMEKMIAPPAHRRA